ncbi:MAG TPA: hypothetical protein VFQ06_09115 [Nitrospira sp.]|nr:hypothetical protein [Nitrospira sp.]
MEIREGAAINLVGKTVQLVTYGPQVKPTGPNAYAFRTRDGLPMVLVIGIWEDESTAGKVANILFDGLDAYAAQRQHLLYDLTMVRPCVPCNCEHTNHFEDEYGPQSGHHFQSVSAGKQRARYVGQICDECAVTCMAQYLI